MHRTSGDKAILTSKAEMHAGIEDPSPWRAMFSTRSTRCLQLVQLGQIIAEPAAFQIVFLHSSENIYWLSDFLPGTVETAKNP